MAIIEVKVPQLSESVAEATLLQWKKRPGEAVAVDEILNIYTSSSRAGGTLQMTLPMRRPSMSVTDVRLTVTGALVDAP